MKDGPEQLNNNVMVQRYSPASVKIVPRDGELEIKLDITINVNTEGVISVEGVEASKKKKLEEDDNVPHIIPDFVSGATLNFGKEVKE